MRGRLRLHTAWAALGLLALTVMLITKALIPLDVMVRDWMGAHRPEVAYRAAIGLNFLGQGSPLMLGTLAVAAGLGWRRRSMRPVWLWAMALVLTMASIGLLKLWARRGAPADANPQAVELFSMPRCFEPECLSYPSGHMVNAIVWYTLLAVLLNRGRMLTTAPAAIVAVTTVYTGFHWLTDTVAGALLGLIVASAVRGVGAEYLNPGRHGGMAGRWIGQYPPERVHAHAKLKPELRSEAGR